MTQRCALISVSNKKGIGPFSSGLSRLGIGIVSTMGTAEAIRVDGGVPVTDVRSYTGFPEMMDGRLHTFHPLVHGGIVARRDREDHVRMMMFCHIWSFEIVVVNLKPFPEKNLRPDGTFDETIGDIDIDGHAMLLSAIQNPRFVTTVVDPGDYERVLNDMRANGGQTSAHMRRSLAHKAFKYIVAYDRVIERYLDNHCPTNE